ncbi:MAG: potassium channel family protein, partial [Bacteroidetes bacterium]|nr:potassium channel family protein [Bacteroidota bacterium]
MSIKEFLNPGRQIISFSLANKLLFPIVLISIFFVPFLPARLHQLTYSFLLTCTILLGTQLIATHRMMFLAYAMTAIMIVWIGDLMESQILKGISKTINMVLFVYIVVALVRKISRAKKVSSSVILESINAYLMIGLVYSILVALMAGLSPGSYNFNNLNTIQVQGDSAIHQYIYYTFITMTTVGYGDIVPLTPHARSLAMMISITGQLYIAIVIAV